MNDARWVVVLEAASPGDGPDLDRAELRQLMEEVVQFEPTALYNPRRYALQLRVDSFTAAEALFSASSAWREALRRTTVPTWPMSRAEVLTPAEFLRESELPLRDASRAASGQIIATRSSDEDPLVRAFVDSLTGLATWELFRDRVRTTLSDDAARRSSAIVLLDIDDFSAVNREHGYTIGDRVLAAVAERIVGAVRDSSATARIGANAFGILLPAPTAGNGKSVARRLLAGVKAPLDLGEARVRLTASAGLAVASAASDADQLIAQAATALASAKSAGGDRLVVFQPGAAPSAHRYETDDHATPDRMAHVVLLQHAALAANDSLTLEAAAASVLNQVCALAGWTAGHLWLAQGNGQAVAATGVWNANVPQRLRPVRAAVRGSILEAGEALPGRVLATGRAAWTHEPRTEAGMVGEPLAEAGVRSVLAFPVHVRDEVVAVLEFFSDRVVTADDGLTDVMASVCSQLGRVVERGRAEAALSGSEERYRTLVDSMPAMIWSSGIDALCTGFNSTWLEYTGRTLEQELGLGWAEGVHPDDLERCMETYLRAFERREAFEMEYRLRRADGQYRWFLDRGAPVGSRYGFSGYVGACIDVTDKRRADELARDREARIRALVQNADVLLIVLDKDAVVVDEYPGTFDLGYDPGSGKGRFGMEYLHPDDLERAALEFADVLQRPGIGRSFECRVLAADGSWRWVRAIANNLLHDPTIGGILITVSDITAKVEVETALRETAAHLREAQALSRTGSWYRDLGTGKSFWSEELRRILGWRGIGDPGVEAFIGCVHPDDRPAVARAIDSLDGGETRALVFRILRPSGEVAVVSSRAAVARDPSGRLLRVFGTIEELDELDAMAGDML